MPPRWRKLNGGTGERIAGCVAKCIITDRIAQAAPMLFPMYTVAADVLLKMTKVEPHEDLKAGAHVERER